MMSHIKVRNFITYHILLAAFEELCMDMYAPKLVMDF